jgi:hypothetical protein
MPEVYDLLQKGFVASPTVGTILPATPKPMVAPIYSVRASNPTTGTVIAEFNTSTLGTVTGTVLTVVFTPNSNYEAKGTDETPVGILQSMEALTAKTNTGSITGVILYSYRYGRAY